MQLNIALTAILDNLKSRLLMEKQLTRTAMVKLQTDLAMLPIGDPECGYGESCGDCQREYKDDSMRLERAAMNDLLNRVRRLERITVGELPADIDESLIPIRCLIHAVDCYADGRCYDKWAMVEAILGRKPFFSHAHREFRALARVPLHLADDDVSNDSA